MHDFMPDWYSPPGDTINELCRDLDYSIDDLAQILGRSVEFVNRLLVGSEKINEELAESLAKLGASKQFWLNRESTYQKDLIRLGV